MQRIPPELLGQIFVNCLPNSNFNKPRTLDAPLLLSKVCRLWRNIVLSVPHLWSSFSITIGPTSCRPSFAAMRTWLARSGMFPLSIEVVVEQFEFNPLTESDLIFSVVVEVLQMVVSHINRWRNIRMVIPMSVHHLFQDIPMTGAPLLETMILDLGLRSYQPETLFPMLRHSPSLRALSWLLKCHDAPPLSLAVPWGHMTHLHIESVLSADTCFNFLKTCPVLVNCRFENVSEHSQGHFHSPCLVHRSLSSFRIGTRNINVRPLLHSLTLPTLRTLTITAHMHPPESLSTSAALPSLLSRSNCPLERLVLEDFDIAESGLIQILSDVSKSLVELDISDWRRSRITDQTVSALTFRAFHHSPCPKLEIIKLRGNVMTTDGTVATMVSSRRRLRVTVLDVDSPQLIARLKSIHVEFGSDNHPEDTLRLKALREKGLKVRIFTR